jgi:hypothetical protein
MSLRKHCSSSLLVFVLLLAFGVAASGCLDRTLKPLNPCLVASVNVGITVDKIDKIDLLFMVDNSHSMKEEQLALSQQFKNIITVLTTGKRAGKPDFTPATDLHLAVVSSDLGTPGINTIPKCVGAGDDGVMQNAGHGPGCSASYPRFLTYDAKVQQPDQTANDFACVAMLGTDGCGYEQQLEASLKALWPAGDGRAKFLGDGAGGMLLGHGDGANHGFLRSDPVAGLSLLAIVLVTDEEDCSVVDPTVLVPRDLLDVNVPLEARLAQQGPNTRCALNPDLLFKTSRYIDGFRALRNEPELVIFAAIVGVPPETVDDKVLARTNFQDTASRDQFYRGILDHPLMQSTVNDNGTPDPQDDEINRSCSGGNALAYPPRRIVEVARGFGANGVVQSICQDDFTPAVNAIIDLISTKIGAVCLPHALVPDSKGLVDCDVIWELPAPGKGPSNTPVACNDPSVPFLRPVGPGEKPRTQAGGARCRVPQLAVLGDADADKRPVPTESDGFTFEEGWYYDTFTAELHQQCDPAGQPQRIGYTQRATPPKGITIKLECLDEIQRLATRRADLSNKPQPAIGDACSDVERNGQKLSGDAACALELTNGQTDNQMFCHAEQQVCVASCQTQTDCPPAWVCDERADSIAAAGGRKHCVNPTCGDRE